MRSATRAKPPADSGLLSADTTTTRTTPPAAQRWINAEIEDHAKEEALVASEWYVLAFDVDVLQRAESLTAAPLLDERLFDQGDDVVEVTVQLASGDFEISAPTRPLRLPRTGKSQGKARFDISPKHDGPSTLTATFHKQGNFIQQLELKFDVGAARGMGLESVSRGRPVSAANVLFPRDVGLSIQPGIGGYECMVWGPVAARAQAAGAIGASGECDRHRARRAHEGRHASGCRRPIRVPEEDRHSRRRSRRRLAHHGARRGAAVPAALLRSRRGRGFEEDRRIPAQDGLRPRGTAQAADRGRDRTGALGHALRRRCRGQRTARLGQLPRHAARHRGDPAAESACGARQPRSEATTPSCR